MREEGINKLLNNTNDRIEQFHIELEKARKDKNIKELLALEVKYCCGDIYSCLEYFIHDIYDFVYKPTDSKTESERVLIYKRLKMPCVKDRNELSKKLKHMDMANLEHVNVRIYNLLESIQPFLENNPWLEHFSNVRNKIDHWYYIGRQRRSDIQTVDIGNGGIVSINCEFASITDCIFNGIPQYAPVSIELNDVFAHPFDMDNIFILKNTEFIFIDTGQNVIELFQMCYNEVKRFKQELYETIS